MRIIPFFVALMLFSIQVLSSQETERFEKFKQTSQNVRQSWNELWDVPWVTPRENTIYAESQDTLKAEEAFQKIITLSMELDKNNHDSPQNSVVPFLQTVTNSFLKNRRDAADCFMLIDNDIVMGMEYFRINRRFNPVAPGNPRWRIFLDRLTSNAFPFNGEQGNNSHWIRFQPRGIWLAFPRNATDYRIREIRTGPLFHELGLYDEAWRAFCEENYFFRRGNWLSVAENAYRAGEHDLAWDFLMKAAMLSSENSYTSILETAKLWIDVEEGKAELPKPKPLTPEERKNKFKEIVLTYKTMNAHPRAWAIIDEYWDEFEAPEELKKEIQDDWLKLIDILCHPSIAMRVILYGYDICRTEIAENNSTRVIRLHDPLDVTIPWIYPEGWQEAAQAMLDKELERLEVTHDRFRMWHTDGGAVSFVAKIVSYFDDNVSFEKEDGTIITIALTNLMRGDQNYVRYLIERKKIDIQLPAIPQLRIWRSPLGEHEMRATFVSGTDNANVIHLKREDGVVIEAYMDLLSPADQEYVKQRLNAEKELKP